MTNYIVEMKDEATGVWKKVTNFARYPRAEVYNLTPDHKYQFRVFAENIYGTGEPLETDDAIVAGYAFSERKKRERERERERETERGGESNGETVALSSRR